MPKKDFLMRMLEQLRGLIPYILDLVQSGNYEEAHAVIDQAVREVVGVGSDGVVLLPEATLLDRLKADQAIAWEDKCLFLATVLFEEGKVLQAEEEEEMAYGRFIKSLNLLLIMALDGQSGLDEQGLVPEIEEVLAALAAFHLPGSACAYLVQYYERQGDYASAEDILYDWLELEPEFIRPDDPNPIEMGLAFYGRLQTLSDAELEAGGLSREEVETAAADLTAYQ